MSLIVLVGLVHPIHSQGKISLEVQREHYIRIVEPVIYPLQRLGRLSVVFWPSDWQEFSRSCGFGWNPNEQAELGQAEITCSVPILKRSDVLGEPPPLEEYYGDRTIQVVVRGFDTKERLCTIPTESTGDFREVCLNDGTPTGRRVRAVVRAKFIITTKVNRYTKEEEESAKDSGLKGRLWAGGWNFFYPSTYREGEPKDWEVKVGKVEYEFPSSR